MNERCSLKEVNEQKKIVKEIETDVEIYVKLIFDILNKKINSTIEQRNNIYKFVKNTDFSDNLYFFNIKNDILEIINKDENLIEEYNKINGTQLNVTQSGGMKIFNAISAAFLAFAAVTESLNYHASQTDYAESVAKLNPDTTLVSLGNQLRSGSCGFGALAIVHGNKLKTVNSVRQDLVNEVGFGMNRTKHKNIVTENRLPNIKVVNVVDSKFKPEAKKKLGNMISRYGKMIKQRGYGNGEFRTLLRSWTYKNNPQKGKVPVPKPWSDPVNGHARALIWDVQGNPAVYDPNIGFIYSTAYGVANPETIKTYNLILANNSNFQVLETPSISDWLVNNQADFESDSSQDKFHFEVDFEPNNIDDGFARDVVSVDSLNNMENIISGVYKDQLAAAPFFSWDNLWGSSGKINKWIDTHQTPKKGGQAPEADTPIDFVMNCLKRNKRNPYPVGSMDHEVYSMYVLYSELYPETLEETEKIINPEPLEETEKIINPVAKDNTSKTSENRFSSFMTTDEDDAAEAAEAETKQQQKSKQTKYKRRKNKDRQYTERQRQREGNVAAQNAADNYFPTREKIYAENPISNWGNTARLNREKAGLVNLVEDPEDFVINAGSSNRSIKRKKNKNKTRKRRKNKTRKRRKNKSKGKRRNKSKTRRRN
jgi:hypothetical protein